MKENTELANDSCSTDISSRDKQNIHAIVLKSNVRKNKLAYEILNPITLVSFLIKHPAIKNTIIRLI